MGAASAMMRCCAVMQMSCESDASALENSRGRAAVQAELAKLVPLGEAEVGWHLGRRRRSGRRCGQSSCTACSCVIVFTSGGRA